MPTPDELPDELKGFPRLDAIRVTGRTFLEDLPRLEAIMLAAFRETEVKSKRLSRWIENVIKLKKSDPEAADRLLAPVVDLVPKYFPSTSIHGEGVPRDNVNIIGRWECLTKLPPATEK